MSKFIVEIDKKEETEFGTAPLEDYSPDSGKGRSLRTLGIFVGVLLLVFAVVGIGGAFYWTHLKTTPQYSLAILVDAARNRDQGKIDEIVDTDAVVEDFVPQVTEKAIELYGRGLPPSIIDQVTNVAAPVMPVVKKRARAELPRLLRERTKRFENIPFFVMAAGAERYLDIKVAGNIARISNKAKNQPLKIVMRKNGDRWTIVAVKDESLAKRIAQKIGQQIISLVRRRGTDTANSVEREIGVGNLGDLIERAGEIFSQNGKKKE